MNKVIKLYVKVSQNSICIIAITSYENHVFVGVGIILPESFHAV